MEFAIFALIMSVLAVNVFVLGLSFVIRIPVAVLPLAVPAVFVPTLTALLFH